MSKGFNRKEVDDLLMRCHRRCCICHRFCGTKIETDHIVPSANSDDHSIENAIPVCFDCHAEIHAYNPRHPRGRSFTLNELRGHKENWLRICAEMPETLLLASREVDSGPIQGMLDELEYNLSIAHNLNGATIGFIFRDELLGRALREGVMSILADDLRTALCNAYGAVSRSNGSFVRSQHLPSPHHLDAQRESMLKVIEHELPIIKEATIKLRDFLQSEKDEASLT